MPKAGSKYRNAKRILYPSFDGGLNLSVPPESLKPNELSDAVNVEYSPRTGAMTVRDGLRFLYGFDDGIECVCPLPEWNVLLVRTRTEDGQTLKLYYVKMSAGSPNEVTQIQEYSGNYLSSLLKYKLQAAQFENAQLVALGTSLWDIAPGTDGNLVFRSVAFIHNDLMEQLCGFV